MAYSFIVLKCVSYILGMDTIIFFYQKRDLVQREITLMYQEDYLLAKVGICADRHSWFSCPLPSAPVPNEPIQNALVQNASLPNASMTLEPPQKGRLPGRASDVEPLNYEDRAQGKPLSHGDGAQGKPLSHGDRAQGKPLNYGSGAQGKTGKHGGWFRRHREMRQRRRELRRQQQEYMQKLQEYDEQREELADNIRQLWKEVFSEVERAGGMDEVSCVYEDSLRFLADGQGEAARCWSLVWNVPEFRDYKSIRWIRPLLEYVRHSDFILLGTADCIPAILQKLARQMKSLQWYLREEDLNEEVQDWVEDFYEEYGLAIALRKLTGGNVFRQLRFKPAGPVCVMDFTDEEKIYAGNLAGGSIWLDFASVEEKSGRMERQAPDVSYMSLKKYWGAKTKRKPIFPECCAASRFRFS